MVEHVFDHLAVNPWFIENNLSISTMDFEEFAAAAEDGVFRGF